MPGRRCCECRSRSKDGFVSSYSAWYPEPDVRVAYKNLYCVECGPGFASVLQSAVGNLPAGQVEDDGVCASCGTNVDSVWCVTYFTVFVPHQDRVDFEAWQCEPCSLKTRAYFSGTGDRLPAREPLRAPAAAAISPWAKLLLE